MLVESVRNSIGSPKSGPKDRLLEHIVEPAPLINQQRQSIFLDEAIDLNIRQKPRNGRKTIREVEREMIQGALEDCDWKIEGHGGAAVRLDMAPGPLTEKNKKFRLQRTGRSEIINVRSA